MNFCDEVLEITEYLLGGFAGPKVVSSSPEKNCLRLARKNDGIGKMRGIDDLRTAKPANDYLLVGKVLCERIPQPNCRGTDKKQGARRRWVGLIFRFEGRDLLFPSGKIVNRFGTAARIW